MYITYQLTTHSPNVDLIKCKARISMSYSEFQYVATPSQCSEIFKEQVCAEFLSRYQW